MGPKTFAKTLDDIIGIRFVYIYILIYFSMGYCISTYDWSNYKRGNIMFWTNKNFQIIVDGMFVVCPVVCHLISLAFYQDNTTNMYNRSRSFKVLQWKPPHI